MLMIVISLIATSDSTPCWATNGQVVSRWNQARILYSVEDVVEAVV